MRNTIAPIEPLHPGTSLSSRALNMKHALIFFTLLIFNPLRENFVQALLMELMVL
jgi:hypothetical protein